MNIHVPQVFEVSSLRAAKAIILTPEDLNTEERWKAETPYLAELAIRSLNITFDSVVLDYGCGIGRLAKELIEQSGCKVVGVDTSASMRAFAASYVDNPGFFACAPEALSLLPKFDKVLAVWVFQHILDLPLALKGLFENMSPGSKLAVANNIRRAIPTNNGWVDDSIDVSNELKKLFTICSKQTQLKPEIVGQGLSLNTYWQVFTKLGD